VLSVIIPNWNGMQFIESCLPEVLKAAAECPFPSEILFIDDASADNSAAFVKKNFPGVTVLQNSVNLGFGASVNKAAEASSGKFLALINNDLRPHREMFARMMGHFQGNDDIFGVSAKSLSSETLQPNHVNMMGRFADGRLRLAWADDQSPAETMFLQGGSSVVRRQQFLEWGGFAHLFAPGYWEDYDLSYFALKNGMRNLYDPGAVGYHHGQGSMIRAHGSDKILRIRERNSHFFLAMNLTDPDFLHSWMKALPAALGRESQLRVLSQFQTCFELLGATGSISRVRRQRSKLIKVSDESIFERFQHRGTLC